jgi:uncharacterized protein YndB with AHSA1/START domain
VTATTVEPFVVERTFDAPRDLVWKAWTQAAHLEAWWGPKGCKLRVLALDLTPGGVFHYAMEFQPGHAMWGRFVYRDIVAPERMVYVSSFADADGAVIRAPFSATWPLEVHNVMTFAAQGERTTLRLESRPLDPTPEEIQTFRGMFDSMRQGFGGTFDQLDDHLGRS